jgi:DNA-binding response OmpR family regulator
VTTFDDGPLHVDFTDQEVTIDGRSVKLNATEYRLLATLVRHQGQVLSSGQLAWDDNSGDCLDRRFVSGLGHLAQD